MKQRVYEILAVSRPGDEPSRRFDIFIVWLIALNVLAVILETEPALATRFGGLFRWFEVASVAIFSVEYLLRLWTAPVDPRYSHPVWGRARWMLTPMALVDLFAVLPFFVPLLFPDLRFLRGLRLFRLFRLAKSARYSKSIQTLQRVLHAKQGELVIALFTVLLILLFASSFMYFIEHQAQPDVFTSIPATMWWGVATLTTVGYGDVYPITPLGRLFGAIIAMLGIGVFALPAGIVASGFNEALHAHDEEKHCPHCGKLID